MLVESKCTGAQLEKLVELMGTGTYETAIAYAENFTDEAVQLVFEARRNGYDIHLRTIEKVLSPEGGEV